MAISTARNRVQLYDSLVIKQVFDFAIGNLSKKNSISLIYFSLCKLLSNTSLCGCAMLQQELAVQKSVGNYFMAIRVKGSTIEVGKYKRSADI